MRLLIVSPYFPPQRGAASVRLWSIAQQAVASGFETDVLTITKEPDQIGVWSESFGGSVYEINPETPQYLKLLRAEDQKHRIEINGSEAPQHRSSAIHSMLGSIRDRTGVYSSVRMPDLTDHWVQPAIEWAKQQQQSYGPWDTVISSCGPYTAHLVAMQIKQSKWAKKWIADFRDLWTANHAYIGLFPWTVRERKLEKQVLAKADAITTVSPPLAHWINKRTQTPVEVIYNGYGEIDLTAFEDRSAKPTTEWNLVYTGQLYSKHQDASAILAAMKSVHESGTSITLTVAGASSEAWNRLAQKIGVQPLLKHLGEVSHQQALELQRGADALVAFEWKDPEAGVLTNKLFEYIAAGPIVLLTGRPGPMAKVLRETGRGVQLGFHPDQVADSLESFVKGDLPLPEQDLEQIKHLSRENQSKRLIQLCEQIGACPF